MLICIICCLSTLWEWSNLYIVCTYSGNKTATDNYCTLQTAVLTTVGIRHDHIYGIFFSFHHDFTLSLNSFLPTCQPYLLMKSTTWFHVFFQVLNPVLIIIMIPLFEAVIYPLLQKMKIPTRPLARMCTGMLLGGLAFILAGLIQLRIEVGFQLHYVLFWCVNNSGVARNISRLVGDIPEHSHDGWGWGQKMCHPKETSP